MTIFKTAIALAALAFPAMALAHPLLTAYQSRGECEAALAQANRADGDRKVEAGEFENAGEATRWMHETFRCERIDTHWFIVLN
jgi:hypothetical protein